MSVVVLAFTILGYQAIRRAWKTPSARPPDIVVIDGAKNPEQFPEYLVWQMGFRELSDIKARQMKLAMESLPLSPQDAYLAYQEADLQYVRDKACADEQAAVQKTPTADARTQTPVERTRSVILRCRQRVLCARDSLLSRMTADGRRALVVWIEKRRTTMQSYVRRSELEFYRRSR